MWAGRVVLGLASLGLGACSLFTPLDELSRGTGGASSASGSTTSSSAGGAAAGGGGAGQGGSGGAGTGGGELAPWTADWSARFGYEGNQRAGGLAITPAGNVVFGVSFTGSMDTFGAKTSTKGAEDLYVGGLTASGALAWYQTYGSSSDDLVQAVAVAPDGSIYATGHFSGTIDFGGGPLTAQTRDIFLLELDPSGSHVWSKSFGGGSSDVGSALLVEDDGVVLVGMYKGTADFGGEPLTALGENDVFVARFTSDGEHVWSTSLGSTGFDHASSIVRDSQGNYVLGGRVGGALVAGASTPTAHGATDAFLVSLQPDGTPRWAQTFGDAGDQDGLAVLAVGGDDRVFVGFELRGSADFGGGTLSSAEGYDLALVAFGAEGEHQWSRLFGGPGDQYFASLHVRGAELVMSGSFESGLDLGGGELGAGADGDVFVASLGLDGAHRSSRGFVFPGVQEPRGAALAPDGSYVVIGDMTQTADFGAGPLTSQGETDLFLARFPD